MFRKLVLFAFRNLRRNFLYTFIVIGGLSLGIATLFSIAQWTAWQISYDRDIENYKDIYRLTLKEKKENFERQTARILHGNIVNQLYNEEDIPEIEDIGLLSPYRNAIVKKDRKIFYENTSYSCDPNFLEIFRPEMVLGDLHSSLTKPHTVLLSEETARKYFGYDNPVGQLIDITHQFGIEAEAFEITGIFRNFPGNSHFHPALLTSYEDPANYHGTAWVYLKVSETSNIPKLETSITEFIKNNNEQEDWEGIEPELMALKDIHLESHLPRELEKNGSRQSVIILFIAGILVFLLAWFNFTLLAISQNQMKINKLIFQWQLGSSKNLFRRQFFIEFLLIGLLALIMAYLILLIFNGYISNILEISLFHNGRLFLVTSVLMLLILIVSSFLTSVYASQRLYKILKNKYFTENKVSRNHVHTRNWFIRSVIVIEFVITFILISNLLMIRSQVNYSISRQIGANDSTTLQIPQLPRSVINKFEVFRTELMKYPVFEEFTAMMEEPGGSAMDAFPYSLEGLPENENMLFVFPVDENFIRFYDLEIIAGRDFPPTYNTEDTTEFFMLNETAARLTGVTNYDELIGRELDIHFSIDGYIYPGNIIGVLRDFHLSDMEHAVNPMVIFPEYTWLYCFSIRINGDKENALKILRNIWEDLFPDYPLRYSFTSEIYTSLYTSELQEINVLLLFGILSLIIAGTGLFALSGFFIQQKMHDAAIRKICGAPIYRILLPELMQYIYLALFSSLISIPLSYLLIQKWMENYLYQANLPYFIFIIIGLTLILFSWISVLYHALRLARLNPTEFIRNN